MRRYSTIRTRSSLSTRTNQATTRPTPRSDAVQSVVEEVEPAGDATVNLSRWRVRVKTVDRSGPARDLALRPLLHIDRPDGWSTVSIPGVDVVFHSLGVAQVAHPTPGLPDVVDAVAAVRDIARRRSVEQVVWWVPPDCVDIGPELEREGLVNQASPAFGARAEALVLAHAPEGVVPADVEVGPARTRADVVAAYQVYGEAFDMPEALVKAMRDKEWSEARAPGHPLQRLVGRLDGVVVGTGRTATASAGLNLLGGAVSRAARGRGVYRALIARRWQLAAHRGTPVLTVQAGPLSQPILERLGFRTVGTIRVYRDDVLAASYRP